MSDAPIYHDINVCLQALNIPQTQRVEILADIRARADPKVVTLPPDAMNAALARTIQRTRLLGNRLIGGRVMNDPRFEMLLELFIAHHEGRPRTVGDLCVSADAPQTTSLRHIERLEQDGFLQRHPDTRDRRRSLVEPTTRAIDGMSAYLNELRRKV